MALDWEKARRRDRATPGPAHNVIRARFPGTCPWCVKDINTGDLVAAHGTPGTRGVFWGHHACIHPDCAAHQAGRAPKNSVTSRNAMNGAVRHARKR